MPKNHRELIEAYGWKSIDSGNPWTASFVHEDTNARINYYFTTGTMVLDRKKGGAPTVIREITTEDLESALMKHNENSI